MSTGNPKKVIDTAACKAPACDFVVKVEDPETVHEAAQSLADHYNNDHDTIDRELAFDRYDEWDREDFEPYNADTGEPLNTNAKGNP